MRRFIVKNSFLGETGPDPDVAKIASCLQNVKNKVVILSGKVGVGKSTISSLLARSFRTLLLCYYFRFSGDQFDLQTSAQQQQEYLALRTGCGSDYCILVCSHALC